MTKVRNERIIKSVGERVRQIRIAKGLSQEEVANNADIPINQIGRIERGEINPTISTLHAIAEALNTTLALLVSVEE